ncbi:MAG TPA: helix-turn-helix transcriptional regulator [Blastocatellia bacterium]|nr:helix-turn-helix transcriptional regulator [Blastocatellia bacterium]
MLILVGNKGKQKMAEAVQQEDRPYNDGVMAGRPPTREAPLFGQRLAAFRRAKGWSQSQLAETLDTTRKMIDYYERRAINPSLDFMQRAAEALDVSLAELLGSHPKRARTKPGPPSQLEVRFDKIKRLPRKEQDFVIKFLDTVLDRAGVS